MKKLNQLIDLFTQTNNDFARIKLQHLKAELENLEKTTPNDYEFGELMRKIIKDENK
jgi:hypothetical protein